MGIMYYENKTTDLKKTMESDFLKINFCFKYNTLCQILKRLDDLSSR